MKSYNNNQSEYLIKAKIIKSAFGLKTNLSFKRFIKISKDDYIRTRSFKQNLLYNF